MSVKRYALLSEDSIAVENIIVAEPSFAQEGYFLVEIESDVFCEPGMYFNSGDGIYYQDEAFTYIYPEAEGSSE